MFLARYPTLTRPARLVLGLVAVVLLAMFAAYRIRVLHLNIVQSDSLYIPLLFESSVLDFRPPSANYLFPDYLYYAISHAFIDERAQALLFAGMMQCAVTTALLARYTGIGPAVAYNALYFLFGLPIYFLISFHHGMILMAILFCRFSQPPARLVMAAAFTLADPLFAFIVCVWLAVKALREGRLDVGMAAALIPGYLGAFYLAESTIELVKFGFIVGVVLLSGWLITLPRLHRAVARVSERTLIATGIGLDQGRLCALLFLVAALISLAMGHPARYALPVLVCALVFLGPGNSTHAPGSWTAAVMVALASLVSLGFFVMPALTNTAHQSMASYACLARALESMHIDTVATDYWTFKPLYFSRSAGSQLSLLPLDFRTGTPNTWINAHRFIRGRTDFLVKNTGRCNRVIVTDNDRLGHCSDMWYTAVGVNSRSTVCEDFEIIELARAVDFSRWADALRSKPAAFWTNLTQNISKFQAAVKANRLWTRPQRMHN
jgi:hypothetical protein